MNSEYGYDGEILDVFEMIESRGERGRGYSMLFESEVTCPSCGRFEYGGGPAQRGACRGCEQIVAALREY